jgi:DNA-binding winged helix-turn-helix (wHTH) protein
MVMDEASRDAPGRRVLRVWRFGNAQLDERTHELQVDAQLVPLDADHVAILKFFLERPGEVIFTDRLAAAIWPDRAVSDVYLTECLTVLRQALGDQQETIIKTAPGFGYRITIPVRVESAVPANLLPDTISDIDSALR